MPRLDCGFTDSSRSEDERVVVALHAKVLRCDCIEGARLVVRAKRLCGGSIDADRLRYRVQGGGQAGARPVIHIGQRQPEAAARSTTPKSHRADRDGAVRAGAGAAQAVRYRCSVHLEYRRLGHCGREIGHVVDGGIWRDGVTFAKQAGGCHEALKFSRGRPNARLEEEALDGGHGENHQDTNEHDHGADFGERVSTLAEALAGEVRPGTLGLREGVSHVEFLNLKGGCGHLGNG